MNSTEMNSNEFNKAKPLYESALKTAGLITVWNLKHLLKMQDETEIGKPYGSICHIV